MHELEKKLNKVDKWIRPNLKEIIKILPFNPIIARKAFDELLFPAKAGNFSQISELFAADPGLMGKFYEEAREILYLKGKSGRTIRNIEDAISLLGIDSVVSILETAMGDEIIGQMEKAPYMELQLIWKETWAIASAGEKLAPHLSLNGKKAHHIGLLADLGMLIFAQLYKYDYFLKTDPMFQKGYEDIYEISSNKRLELEKKYFDVTHPELGAWLLAYFGLGKDYVYSVLTHEDDEVEIMDNKYPSLINHSRHLSRVIMMPHRYNKVYKGNKTLELQEKFAKENIKEQYSLFSVLDKELDIPQKEVERMLNDVSFLVEKHTEDITGRISLLEEKDFLEALKSVSRDRKKAIAKLTMLIDGEINNHLPQPVAEINLKLADRKTKAEEFPSLSTSLLSIFIRIITSTCLSIYLGLLDHNKNFYNERIITLIEKTNNDLKNRIFLDMGSGVHISYLIAEEILKQKDIPLTASRYAGFVLENKDLLFELLDMRKRMKTGRTFNPEQFVNKTTIVLRNFAALKAVYYIVNGLDYDPSQKTKPFMLNLLSWMDITPVKMRQNQYINRAEPMQTAKTGLMLYTPGDGGFLPLPDFIVYRQCTSCRQKHFYLADALRPLDLKYKNKLSVKLMPLGGEKSCPPVIWNSV